MVDFQTEAELSLSVPQRELRGVRSEIEDALSDIEVSVDGSDFPGQFSPASQQMGGQGQRMGRFQRMDLALAEERTDYLEQIAGTLDDLEDDGLLAGSAGGGEGDGGGGAISGIAGFIQSGLAFQGARSLLGGGGLGLGGIAGRIAAGGAAGPIGAGAAIALTADQVLFDGAGTEFLIEGTEETLESGEQLDPVEFIENQLRQGPQGGVGNLPENIGPGELDNLLEQIDISEITADQFLDLVSLDPIQPEDIMQQPEWESVPAEAILDNPNWDDVSAEVLLDQPGWPDNIPGEDILDEIAFEGITNEQLREAVDIGEITNEDLISETNLSEVEWTDILTEGLPDDMTRQEFMDMLFPGDGGGGDGGGDVPRGPDRDFDGAPGDPRIPIGGGGEAPPRDDFQRTPGGGRGGLRPFGGRQAGAQGQSVQADSQTDVTVEMDPRNVAQEVADIVEENVRRDIEELERRIKRATQPGPRGV